MNNPTRRLLVLTSTFPRWKDDTEPRFVFDLCNGLSDEYAIDILAPAFRGASKREVLGTLNVFRFAYAPERLQSLCYEGGMTANLKAHPLRWALVPLFFISATWHTIILLRRHRYDVIHAHWLLPQGIQALVARFAARAGGPAVVVTSHGADLFGLRGRIMRRLKRWVIRRADTITVVSRAMKEHVHELEPRAEVHVAPMGIDARQTFTPGPFNSRNHWELLFVGRLAEKKGVSVLLGAMSLLAHDYPELRLSIAGSGPDEAMLRSLAEELSISDSVRFLGRLRHEQLVGHYRKCAISIVPSVVAGGGDEEGLGLTAAEAMACGAPVIASDLRGLRDVIVDREDGLLIEAGDAAKLADAIRHLLEHRQFAERLGEAARDSALKNFDWTMVIKHYREILAGATGAKQLGG